MRKLMLLAAVLALALVAVAPAMAQDDPQVVADAVNKTATAGGPSGANADANCDDEIIESKAGGVVAKAPCKPEPAPAPKAAPAPAPAPPKAELPKSGGPSSTSLLVLGAGTLLVAGGLVARRIVR